MGTLFPASIPCYHREPIKSFCIHKVASCSTELISNSASVFAFTFYHQSWKIYAKNGRIYIFSICLRNPSKTCSVGTKISHFAHFLLPDGVKKKKPWLLRRCSWSWCQLKAAPNQTHLSLATFHQSTGRKIQGTDMLQAGTSISQFTAAASCCWRAVLRYVCSGCETTRHSV